MAKVEKKFKTDSGTEYRILKFKDRDFELQYKAPMFPGSLRNEWKYCGDFETSEEAKSYANKRDAILNSGGSVML